MHACPCIYMHIKKDDENMMFLSCYFLCMHMHADMHAYTRCMQNYARTKTYTCILLDAYMIQSMHAYTHTYFSHRNLQICTNTEGATLFRAHIKFQDYYQYK